MGDIVLSEGQYIQVTYGEESEAALTYEVEKLTVEYDFNLGVLSGTSDPERDIFVAFFIDQNSPDT